jgi:hypothetical protein
MHRETLDLEKVPEKRRKYLYFDQLLLPSMEERATDSNLSSPRKEMRKKRKAAHQKKEEWQHPEMFDERNEIKFVLRSRCSKSYKRKKQKMHIQMKPNPF